MKKHLIKYLFFILCLCSFANVADAQKKRSSTKRSTTRKTTKSKTKAQVSPTASVDSVATTAAAVPPAPVNDSLPVKKILKSLRPDEAVDSKDIRDRIPL